MASRGDVQRSPDMALFHYCWLLKNTGRMKVAEEAPARKGSEPSRMGAFL